MRRFRFVLGLLVAALGVAADPPPAAPSVETKLRKLEIRRISGRPSYKKLCGKRVADEGGSCTICPFTQTLEFAFNMDARRIFGPDWMATDRYLLYFEYDSASCPRIPRSLVREILIEKFSITVRPERRVSQVLVLRAPAGNVLPPLSERTACSSEPPAREYGIVRDQTEPGMGDWAGQQPENPVTTYQGCTVSELARLLEKPVGLEVIDETGLASRHDFALHTGWVRPVPPEKVARQLSEQLGIEAAVDNRFVEVLSLDAPRPPKRIEYEAVGPLPPAPCPEPTLLLRDFGQFPR